MLWCGPFYLKYFGVWGFGYQSFAGILSGIGNGIAKVFSGIGYGLSMIWIGIKKIGWAFAYTGSRLWMGIKLIVGSLWHVITFIVGIFVATFKGLFGMKF